jgi:hypothetical protein
MGGIRQRSIPTTPDPAKPLQREVVRLRRELEQESQNVNSGLK